MLKPSILSLAKNNPPFRQIVGRQLHSDLVARHNSNKVLAHSPSNVGKYLRSSVQLNLKSRIRESLGYRSFNFEGFFFFRHAYSYKKLITGSLRLQNQKF